MTISGLSNDGTVAVGSYAATSQSTAAFLFRNVDGTGTSVRLPGFDGAVNVQALGVSADGRVAVGFSSPDSSASASTRAAIWIDGGRARAITSSGFTYSLARAVSSDGSVVTGEASGGGFDGQFSAFRWTQAGQMVSLGAIGRYGESFSSSGNDISADGSVIVGSSTAPTGFVAFRWTQAGGMVALASLPGETRSVANAVSADGTVTVGTSSAGFTDSAVRWTSAGAQSIADWLAAAGANNGANTYTSAADVSADGTMVIGQGNINGTSQAYLARAAAGSPAPTPTPTPTPTPGTGVIGLDDFSATVMQAAPNRALQGSLGLMMWGAHHRILTDYVQPGRGCAWTVLDYRRDGRNDTDSVLAEAGACVDAGPLRLGAGIGYDRSDSDLTLGGKQKLEGWHGVAEADLRLGQSGAVLSATASLW